MHGTTVWYREKYKAGSGRSIIVLGKLVTEIICWEDSKGGAGKVNKAKGTEARCPGPVKMRNHELLATDNNQCLWAERIQGLEFLAG